jgi:PhnB protein
MNSVNTSITPWLTVKDGTKAVEFYKTAFDATETYRLDEPGAGVVVKLSVNGAEFWISDGEEKNDLAGNVRMILMVSNPEKLVAQALRAGATEIFPVGEGHGWKLGRIKDPFGLHWEIGYPHDTD